MQLKIRCPLVVLETQQAFMPLTSGVLRPLLLLPHAANEWGNGKLNAVLSHELGHIRRWDCLTQLIGQLFCAVYWFHPLSWLINRRLRFEAEAACDDIVIQSGSLPAAYAEHLLQIAKSYRPSKGVSPSAVVPMAHSPKLKSRLRSILDCHTNRKGLSSRFAALGMVLAMFLTLALSTFSLPAGDGRAVESERVAPESAIRATTFEEPAVGESPVPATQALLATQAQDDAMRVREGGRLESAPVTTVRSGISKPTAIIWAALEGKRVGKGDLVVELDDSLLEAEIEGLLIENAKANAALEAARQGMEQAKRESKSTVELLELHLELAVLQTKRAQAELELNRKSLESELLLAKERLELAQRELERAQEASSNQLISEEDFSGVRLRLLEAQSAYSIASAKHENLDKSGGRLEIVAGDLAVKQAQAELARAKSQGENNMLAAELDLRSLEAVYQIRRQALERLNKQLQHCKVYAPHAGIVVHVDPPDGAPPLRNGSLVRRGQPLIQVHDMTGLQVSLQVIESKVGLIKVGQSATIEIDALPEQLFKGTVKSVGVHPKDGPTPRPVGRVPVSFFEVVVALNGPVPEALRPGMSALVEIESLD
jgi:multidrug resistance efflux pump